MTLAPYTNLPAAQSAGDDLERWGERLRVVAEYAAAIGDTDFVPTDLRSNRAAITAAILYGAEVGLQPMQALQKVVIVKGRPSLYAETQRALVLAAGHELWLEESTPTRAIAAGRRKGSDRVHRVAFTMDDARRANLAGQQNYRTYPREMLVARATSALCRQAFPDVVGGLAAVEELEGDSPNGVVPVALEEQATAAPATRTRVPEPEPEPEPPAPPDPEDAAPDADPAEALVEELKQEFDATEVEPPADPPATEGLRRKMFALMRDVGLTAGGDDRDARLAYLEKVVGRPLQTSSELTMTEATRVVDDLEEIRNLPAPERPFRLGLDEIPY